MCAWGQNVPFGPVICPITLQLSCHLWKRPVSMRSDTAMNSSQACAACLLFVLLFKKRTRRRTGYGTSLEDIKTQRTKLDYVQ